jgi:CRP/FNR family transcriptional regulator, cyclic AMP receptor protein
MRTGRLPALYLGRAEADDVGPPDLFAGLSGDERMRLEAACSILNFRVGQEMFGQGEFHNGIFIILSGQVRSYYVGPTGREISVAYWSRGDLVGGRPRSCTSAVPNCAGW